MAKKLLFVYNPKSGKAKIKNNLSDILEVFTAAGYEITIHPTQYRGDAIEQIAHRSPDYELVVCGGGDGTLDEVVSGMMKSGFNTPVGYIPAGSTNDFGGSLGLPQNMVQAAEKIVKGENFACDVGAFNDNVFVYVAAFGMFTDVSYETDQDIKNMLGHMAYVLEGMKRLSSIRSFHLKISYEDQVIEDDFVLGMVTNSLSVGGFKGITGQNVELDDGLFEVTMIKLPRNAMELNNIIISLLNRDVDSEFMHYFKTGALTIESEEELAWTLDGEFGGNHRLVQIENRNKAIEIRV